MTAALDRNVLFCRMIGFLDQRQLDSLADKTVAVGGAGGVGFTHAEAMVRQGIGRIKISDFDNFGPENTSRQFGCTTETIGRNKAEVLEQRLRSINPGLRVDRFGALSRSNVADFLSGADFVCDGVDYFSVLPHRLLHAEARSRGIPSMIVAPVGYGCTIHVFEPDGMSFDEYFDVNDSMTEQAQLDNWGIGLGPSHLYRHYMEKPFLDMENRTASMVSSICLLSSALMASAALRRLLNLPMSYKPVPYIYHLDVVTARFEELHVPDGVPGIKADPKKYMR
jgi:molybdopterin/thiamine biosynthesis adenylyltransferase